MVRLVKDEKKIDVKDGKFYVTRTIVEEFDAMEYLHHITQFENSLDATRSNLKKAEKDLELFKKYKNIAQTIRKKEIEEQKKKLEEAKKREAEKNAKN